MIERNETLAHHSDIRLTMDAYIHVDREEQIALMYHVPPRRVFWYGQAMTRFAFYISYSTMRKSDCRTQINSY